MGIISYTRNFEDVMLNRALSGVERGFYLDVGAFHPVVDSNTYAFYRRGWRGIALEPQAKFRELWDLQRPLDIFIGSAVGDRVGEAAFYELESSEQSATISPAIAELHRSEGKIVHANTIPLVTLDQVLSEHRPTGEIHCLSIDVEGAEAAVLAGLDRSRFRPWLIILESTVPDRPQPNYEGWEPLLLETGYEFAYFDAVNRFYLAKEHRELKQHFQFPPCVWDGFMDFRLVHARDEAARAQAEVARLKAQLRQLLG